MVIQIKIPGLGESITEVQIASWLVKEGDSVAKDQNLVSIESEKATVEIPAPEAGVLASILKPDGSVANVGDVIGEISAGGADDKKSAEAAPAPRQETASPDAPPVGDDKPTEKPSPTKAPEKPRKKASPQPAGGVDDPVNEQEKIEVTPEPLAVREKEESTAPEPVPEEKTPAGGHSKGPVEPAPGKSTGGPSEDVKPMSPLRRTVAKRLVEAQRTMAILTTFNEIDMSAVVGLRKKHQEAFQAKAGVKLGFMSFFVKAVIEALRAVPQLNAEIRGNDIVYHRSFDIGVAIGAGKGLVVPPLRNAGGMSFAAIEKAIADLGARARENKLKPEELEGGTFTISNGGIYGSLLSTPIINPPQSGILGLHAIQDRPVVRDGQIVIRPMMYVALSYDHRIVDGREAVQFLVRVKELIEDPARLLLEV